MGTQVLLDHLICPGGSAALARAALTSLSRSFGVDMDDTETKFPFDSLYHVELQLTRHVCRWMVSESPPIPP